ncbi:hypothetical protein COY05_05000 [Candidatus Peregrinibacteria bacterium CG_4_10_14_0_2_um_filter_38_24]|nr:MAG: hypothetical protein COY05_05000 [Candidatus Peregrinibacteria bacterium CG_4_10_14_0_2_um_filter_38_24]PJC38842.1 MAG: hypothetical protein CO044_02880 [Candidatus Peregrinibacteria bacterium CG_4_9_14_0_2_um_filter_38_9]
MFSSPTKKFKTLIFCLLILFVFSSCNRTADNRPDNGKEKLSWLNSEYGLMGIEALNGPNNLTSRFASNTIKTNIFDIFKAKKELVIKVKNDVNSSPLGDVFLLKLRTNAEIQDIASQYDSLDFVEYAEPNFQVELSDDGVNKYNDEASTVDQVHANSDIVVAVIDSGVDVNHKDLKNRIVAGYDAVSDDKDVSDDYGHGTHVAGIIASNSSAKIMPIKFTDGKTGKMSDLAKAIKFAVDNDVDVINLSLGLKKKSALLMDSVDYAFKNDISVVSAAGNYNTSKKYYPAAYGKVIAVTGLANDGTKLPQSNFGTWVDYAVKAQDILSTMPGNKYGYATGTSQAAPFVTAKIVRILEKTKDLSIRSILIELGKISTSINTGKFALLLGREL